MRYLSTRGHAECKRFSDILLEGLAPDGGLYLPDHYPRVDASDLQRLRHSWRSGGYATLAFELLKRFIDDIPEADLRDLCAKTYRPVVFGHPLITPVRQLEPGLSILALSNGPTLAFKDMAMQLLGHLFEYELERRNGYLNVLGATSGDTGSAAEYAMRGKSRIQVFMTSPNGRMSPFQQAQMFTLLDTNIHNLAVEGVFDDCQDLVKAVSNDLSFKRHYQIGTVNSINWARMLAQVVYYFAGFFQLVESNDQVIDVSVPSGNFGNVCAGHVARMMGLPIRRLIVATNENDVLDEFFKTGVYQTRDSAGTHETSSPSMDISKASNFERFIFDLLERDPIHTSRLFGESLTKTGRFDLSQDSHFSAIAKTFGFFSGNSTHANRLDTIRLAYTTWHDLIDPHTADGLKVALEYRDAKIPMLVLETALPIKFSKTINQALGFEPPMPDRLSELMSLPKRFQVMSADLSSIKQYIQQHAIGHALAQG